MHEIVMQWDVLAPLISSLQVVTMGKECLEEAKHLYLYKVAIPPLGMVDDLFTITTCEQVHQSNICREEITVWHQQMC